MHLSHSEMDRVNISQRECDYRCITQLKLVEYSEFKFYSFSGESVERNLQENKPAPEKNGNFFFVDKRINRQLTVI